MYITTIVKFVMVHPLSRTQNEGRTFTREATEGNSDDSRGRIIEVYKKKNNLLMSDRKSEYYVELTS